MDAEAHREIVREIEKNKASISAHERECALRYGQILSDISEIKGDLKTAVNRGAAAAWGANWRAWAVAGFLFVALLGGLGWTTGQLYALEPARMKAETSK